MKFPANCRTRIGNDIHHLGSFCSFFNWEGADIRSQIRPRKIHALMKSHIFLLVQSQVKINKKFRPKIVNMFFTLSFIIIMFWVLKEPSHH